MGCIKCGSKVYNDDMYCNNCRPDYFKEASGERNTDENGMFNVDNYKKRNPIIQSNKSENLGIRRKVVNTRTTPGDLIGALVLGIIFALITTSYYSAYEGLSYLAIIASMTGFILLLICCFMGNMKSKALLLMSVVYWAITSVKFIVLLGIDAYI